MNQKTKELYEKMRKTQEEIEKRKAKLSRRIPTNNDTVQLPSWIKEKDND